MQSVQHTPTPLPPNSDVADDDDLDLLDDDIEELSTVSQGLPVPEPEVQPLRPTPNQAPRHVRRIDRPSDLMRGGRVPSGDAIDIPAFLRKR